ncbi:alpha,alpha-trehalose-phosphate synthase (UDP-forming) [Oricola cellulosilytica]|uniref:Trehalose-6-phosphate synthase n=1 Tax=Oricola cellulosilytica TaxID=1429082 RepID=A0A4R0P640_9HYPH|nr:trehalose-6-phosphate synthase [Oricola cellulosilytica]TCD12373.1 trehalose-6-phosphate synthase [Oricola cellulosilytica]
MRLVVVSNRVADLRKTTQSGGLAVALADAMRDRGGVWLGWDGQSNEKAESEPQVEDVGSVRVISLPLPKDEYENYYAGYANSVLWPLFHYRLDLISYDPAYLRDYHAINQRFADALIPHLQEDDLVWIQDYHLIPLGGYLRQRGCRNRLGFFLHIPFPPHDLLAAAPEHADLIKTLMAYDVVGMQTETDALHLKHYLEAEMTITPDEEGYVTSPGGRRCFIGRFPIGIDVEQFRRMAEDMPDDVHFDMMRNQILDRKQVIGVDRLDYSKGLPQRVDAVDRLLTRHPEMEGRFSLLQISPPTRENVEAYANIRDKLEAMTGRVNGKYSDFNWTPVRYIHRSVSRDKLAGLYRASAVAFVTPLRDGMNLVAKEFVAAQDPNDPGVLVLSQFAGAAEEMTEALIVNPIDVDDMAEKLYQALTMPIEERRRRHEWLYECIRKSDTKIWLEDFLACLAPPMDDAAAAA